MEQIAVYVMGSLVQSNRGDRSLLVAMDYYSKWPEAYAIPSQNAKTVAKVLVNSFVYLVCLLKSIQIKAQTLSLPCYGKCVLVGF